MMNRRTAITGLGIYLVGTLLTGNPFAFAGNEKEKLERKVKELYNEPEDILLAKMIFGEGRDCGMEERVWIGYTPINRITDGKSYTGKGSLNNVLLHPNQYKCFSPTTIKNRKNLRKVLTPKKYEPNKWDECLFIARKIIEGKLDIFNKGQVAYVAKWRLKELKNEPEKLSWLDGYTPINSKRFKHQFYKQA
ncbi:MAG: hypothetical protein ABIJ14_00750 [Nanoarchaeota archaeon]|nr:cell wall hydrolase [Nanoarchaeota archaeon]